MKSRNSAIGVVLVLLAALLTPASAAGPSFRGGAHITSATTTTLVTGVAGQSVSIQTLFICVDAGGAATNVTIQDSAGTNLVGASVVFAVGVAQCIFFPRVQGSWFNAGAAGNGLQIVTSANGPTEVYFEALQQ